MTSLPAAPLTSAAVPDPAAAPDFDRLARIYRWLEWASFGPWLRRCRCAFLPSLGDRRRALVLGDGDGRFTARLLRTNPAIEVDAVDASGAMLAALLRRAGTGHVRACQVDVRQWQPPRPAYDLIVTHFLLDCLTTGEVETLAAKLRSASNAETLWIVSEFAEPPSLFGRLIARPLIRCLYGAFGLLTGLRIRALPDHHTALENAGFTLERRRTWLAGLLAAELWKIHSRNEPQEDYADRMVSTVHGASVPAAFQINAADNVATLLDPAGPGAVRIRGATDEHELTAREAIEPGHKIAVTAIAPGEQVIKYGVVIGVASRAIAQGEWVHLHNCHSPLDERSNAFDVHTGAPQDVTYE